MWIQYGRSIRRQEKEGRKYIRWPQIPAPAVWEIRSKNPTPATDKKGKKYNMGQQCTYDKSGKLITHTLSAGTPDLGHMSGSAGDMLSHGRLDVFPYIDAKKLDRVLERKNFFKDLYLKVRPPNNANLCPENP